MPKKINKVICLLTCLIMVLTNSPIAIQAEQTNVQRGIDFLLNHGYSYEDVKTFPEDDLIIIANATEVTKEEWYCETDENGIITNDSSSSNVSLYSLTGSDSATTPSGKLKQTVSVFGLSDNNVLITYSFKWLINPTCKNTDACAVFFDGAKLITVNNAYHSYKMRNLATGSTGSTITNNRATSSSSNGVGFTFTFAEDTTHAGGIKDHTSADDYGYISCRAKIKSDYLCVWSEYYHQQSSLDFSPTMSLSGFDVDLSINYKMELMSPNPYLYVNI